MATAEQLFELFANLDTESIEIFRAINENPDSNVHELETALGWRRGTWNLRSSNIFKKLKHLTGPGPVSTDRPQQLFNSGIYWSFDPETRRIRLLDETREALMRRGYL